jgi:hypothetical protein
MMWEDLELSCSLRPWQVAAGHRPLMPHPLGSRLGYTLLLLTIRDGEQCGFDG